MLRLSILIAAVLGAAACARSPSAPTPLAPGSWGGDHIALTIVANGGRVDLDCAHGSIDEPFAIDASGRFDLAGAYVREHGGPIKLDDPEDRHPARYTGRVDGTAMSLSIDVAELKLSIGPFDLRRGGQARVVKCL